MSATASVANPLGINGFAFVEFSAPAATGLAALAALFVNMGFTAVSRHQARNITRYQQGGVSFLLNAEPASFASQFATAHGPCACGFAIFVNDSASCLETVLARGAEQVLAQHETAAVAAPAIKGIGDCMLYLVTDASDLFADYQPIAGAEQTPVGFGLTFIDHLTHNLYFGNMAQWANYYERLFGFREIRYFDIKGAKTSLVSKALTAPDGVVRIPLNESSDPKSQINEYLDQYHGEGIQHIAMGSNDLLATVDQMRAKGVKLLDTIDTYYELIDQRIPDHGENVAELRRRKVLVDGKKGALLLQIFSENQLGPIFFEFIQRKGDDGFGEGNFKALFESIELDQMRRGVLEKA